MAGRPTDDRAQPRLLLYLPLLVLLPKHLRKGMWTGRTLTIDGILLLVVGAKLRTPWLLLAWIPDFNTEELEALLRDLQTPDDANQAAGMTIAVYNGLQDAICYIT